jgi:hypothetical protein
MPALVAGIDVLNPFEIKGFEIKDVDGRDKPGHVAGGSISRAAMLPDGRDFMGVVEY